MRWTRNDSLAYEAFSDAGNKLKDTLQRRKAGDEYKSAYGLGSSSADEYDKYAAQFADSNPEAAASYRQAADRVRSGVDVAPTTSERQSRGLEAMGNYYFGQGDQEQGSKLLATGQQLRNGNMQAEKLGLDLSSAKSLKAAQDELQAALKDPEKYFTSQYNSDAGPMGQGDHAGRKIMTVKTGNGPLMYMVDADGKTIDSSARHYTTEEAQDAAMRSFLAKTDPKVLMTLAQKDKETAAMLSRYDKSFDTQLKIASMHANQRGAAGLGGRQLIGRDDNDNPVFQTHTGLEVSVGGKYAPFTGKMSQIKGLDAPTKPGKTGISALPPEVQKFYFESDPATKSQIEESYGLTPPVDYSKIQPPKLNTGPTAAPQAGLQQRARDFNYVRSDFSQVKSDLMDVQAELANPMTPEFKRASLINRARQLGAQYQALQQEAAASNSHLE